MIEHSTPRRVTRPDADGVKLWDWDFFGSAFGSHHAGGGAGFNLSLRFPGQHYDPATGLHYNYFRDYEPGTGRYTQFDPIGLIGGMNTYAYALAYALSNPLMYSDPSGLVSVCRAVSTTAGAIIGGGIGYTCGCILGGIVGGAGGTLVAPGVGTVGGAAPRAAAVPEAGAVLRVQLRAQQPGMRSQTRCATMRSPAPRPLHGIWPELESPIPMHTKRNTAQCQTRDSTYARVKTDRL